MITAIALVQAVADQSTELGQALADVQGVSEVYSFTGKDVDFIVIVRVIEPEQLVVIADQLSRSDGVLNINTHIAFQHYSNMDIQAGFSPGFNHLT
jgi:DNA-binding Lrp family transcriptional regulator